MEAVAEYDETLLEKYLEGEEISEQDVISAIRKATVDVKIIPVLCGSAFKNKGVQRLMDAIVHYLPSPKDLPAITGLHPRTDKEISRKQNKDEPFSALAFKIMTDPYVGKLTFFRVYSGSAKAGSYIFNPISGKKERFGRILQMHANSREDLKEVFAGDIAAAVGLKYTRTGDTLCDDNHHIILESMHFPEPVISVAIEPKTKVDQDKLTNALTKTINFYHCELFSAKQSLPF